ncbi:hypothetical protein Cantr_00668 [Candida viswanathii]|uniref:Uncharacterized protein n=1 Tax=Candida viswanathii TaxID=5486 RepID=A0A367YGV1_9ASCO|nr:hypothetical protein Cantr_00668 [Candida viswanathii]
MPVSNELAESGPPKEPKVILQFEVNQCQSQEPNAQQFKDQMAQVEPQPVQRIPTQPRAYSQPQAQAIEPQMQQTLPQEVEDQPLAQIQYQVEDQSLAQIQPQAQEQQVKPQAEAQPAIFPAVGALFKPNRYGAPKKARKNSEDKVTSVDATSLDSVTPPLSFIVTLKLLLKPTFMVTLKLPKKQELSKTPEPPKVLPQPKPKKVSGPISLRTQAQMLKDIEDQMGYAKRALDELAVEQQSSPLSRTRKRKAQKKRSIIRQLLKDREELLNPEVVGDDDDEEEHDDENVVPDDAYTGVTADAVADVGVNPREGARGASELNDGPLENGKYDNAINIAVETADPAVSNEPDKDPAYPTGNIATSTGNPSYVYHGGNEFAHFPNHVPPKAFTHTPAFNPTTAFNPVVTFDTVTTFGPPGDAPGFGPVNGNGPTAYNGPPTNCSFFHHTAGHGMTQAGIHRRMQPALHRKCYEPKGILKWPPKPLASDDTNGAAFKRPHEDTGDDDIRDRKRVRFGDVTVWD